jgi:hypothetical protein
VHCTSSRSGTVLGSIHVSYTVNAWIHVAGGHLCGGRICGSLPAAFGRCEYIVSFPLVCLSLGCSLGWPAGVGSILSMGEQPLSVWRTRGPEKVLPMCSHLLGRLPSDEIPGVSPVGVCPVGYQGLPVGYQGLPVGATLSCASYQLSHMIPAISSLSYCHT